MFCLWEKGLVKCRCMHDVYKMNVIVLNEFCMYMSWCMNVRCMFLSKKINPWLLLRSFGKLTPGFPLGMKSIHISKLYWKDASAGVSLECQLLSGWIQDSQFFKDEVVNCYLIGSRLHGNLLGKNKSTVFWSNSRLRRKFLEIECYLVGYGLTTTYWG